MNRLVVLDDYHQVALSSADWSTVQQRYEIDVVTEHLDEDATAERLQDATVVVAMRERTPFSRSLLQRLPELRLLVTTGARNASIDLVAADDHGVTVCGTSASGNGVVEIAFGMMIALARNFVAEDGGIRAGGWQHTIGPGLVDRTLGLLGLGRLGVAMVPVARAFGMDVVAWSPNLTAERAAAAGVAYVERDVLFAAADFLSVHLVLSDRTRGLVDAADLARMKPTAYLVNTSRGPIVDEHALLDALAGGRIAGAALDCSTSNRCRPTARGGRLPGRCCCRTSGTSPPRATRRSTPTSWRTSTRSTPGRRCGCSRPAVRYTEECDR